MKRSLFGWVVVVGVLSGCGEESSSKTGKVPNAAPPSAKQIESKVAEPEEDKKGGGKLKLDSAGESADRMATAKPGTAEPQEDNKGAGRVDSKAKTP
jgi:hypothetical protein